MSFQGPLFFSVISWISLSKKTCLIFLIILLNILQSSISFETLYFSGAFWQSSFHHDFECLVILTIFECLNQICLVLSANFCTIYSRTFLLEIHSISSLMIKSLSLTRKFISSSLFLTIICFLVWICSLIITILIVSEVWSKDNLHSGWIIWLSNSEEVSYRNIRSITEFKLFWLFKYLVGYHKLNSTCISTTSGPIFTN